MVAESKSGPGDTAGREITISRVFNYPRELVYTAFTDPKHLIQWWGPTGFRNTFHSFELKPGGRWSFMMHGPDGKDWPNLIVYHEIVPNQRLVYSHGSSEEDPEHFRVTITFVDLGGKTELTMRSIFPTVEACEAVKKFGAIEGGKQTLSKLGEHLAKM